jgi:hypothetical protein
MNTNTTKYKNISFNELNDCIKNNPNKNHKLSSIEIKPIIKSQYNSLESLGLKDYNSFNLTPSGILSMFTYILHQDTYSILPLSSKSTIISELATTLQQKTDELKNTHLSRKRKKIHDLIGASYNSPVMDDKEYLELFNGLSFLTNNNFILLKSTTNDDTKLDLTEFSGSGYKGDIYFSSDPNNWRKETPIWIADYKGRWIATTESYDKTYILLPTWLLYCEQNGWIIQWPEIDGTKEYIIEQLSLLPTWNLADKSHKKEILSKRLGKSKVLELFTKWIMKIEPDLIN